MKAFTNQFKLKMFKIFKLLFFLPEIHNKLEQLLIKIDSIENSIDELDEKKEIIIESLENFKIEIENVNIGIDTIISNLETPISDFNTEPNFYNEKIETFNNPFDLNDDDSDFQAHYELNRFETIEENNNDSIENVFEKEDIETTELKKNNILKKIIIEKISPTIEKNIVEYTNEKKLYKI